MLQWDAIHNPRINGRTFPYSPVHDYIQWVQLDKQ